MPYGTIKVDNIVFTNSGVDQTIGVSGLVQSVSGNLTATGTISGNLIRGNTVSGATITGSVLSVTSGLFTSGTVSAPTIGFAGDGNTGFWTPAGDTVALSTGGSERIRVDADGDLGVGTTDPTSRLTVRADAASGPNTIIRVENKAASAGATTQNIKIEGIFDYNNGTSDASAGAILFGKEGTYTTATTANDSYLAFETVTDNSSTEKLRINSTGQLITTISGTAAAPAVVLGNDVNSGLYSPGADQVAISTGGTERLRIDSNGDLLSGTTGNLGYGGRNLILKSGQGYAGIAALTTESRFFSTWDTTTIPMTFYIGGTERARITSAGNVGIGTSSPAELLDLDGDGDSYLRWERDGSAGSYSGVTSGGVLRIGPYFSATDRELALFTDNANKSWITTGTSEPLVFGINKTERARIDSSGRLLVGTSTSRSVGAERLVQIEGTSPTTTNISVVSNSNDISPARLVLGKSRGTSNGSVTIVNSDDILGIIAFYGADGATLNSIAAQILCSVDGTPGTNDMPGRLVFSTTADGAGSPTERMRIDSSGNLWVGKTSEASLTPISAKAVIRAGSANVLALESSVAGGSVNLDFDGLASNGLQSGPRVRLTQGHVTSWESYFAISNGGGGTLTERLRIDSAGRLLVGTSTSTSLAGLAGLAQVESATAATAGLSAWCDNETAGFGSYLALGRSRGSTVGSNTAVQNNDDLGRIYFFGANGADRSNWAAEILCSVDGTPFSGGDTTDLPGRLVFSTTADGAASPTEAMRINNQRELLIGTTTRTANGGVLQISNGITFPGTQSACSDANTLDDYEEGTFTPVFRDGISGTAATATTTYGSYTKIGNCVRFHIVLNDVNTSGLTSGNTIHITGLPFTGFNGNGVEQSFPAVFNSGTVAANYVTMQILGGASYGRLITNSTTGQALMPVSVATSGQFDIWISGVYFV